MRLFDLVILEIFGIFGYRLPQIRGCLNDTKEKD